MKDYHQQDSYNLIAFEHCYVLALIWTDFYAPFSNTILQTIKYTSFMRYEKNEINGYETIKYFIITNQYINLHYSIYTVALHYIVMLIYYTISINFNLFFEVIL